MTARQAKAIILYDHWYRNSSAPTGSLANSGWQWEGNWGNFLGTPIAKNYFITASHVGGSVGQSLVLNGVSYPTVAVYDDPSTDLRIWKTSKSFSSWAPLYTTKLEVGKTAVLIGRGTGRGSDVNVNGTLHGWQWGVDNHIKSWGQNKLKNIVNGGSGIGDVIGYSFDRSGHGDYVSNEGIVSSGDSSGAVFVYSYSKWMLAGLLYSVEKDFKTPGGAAISAAIFDKGGLSYNGSFIPDTSTDQPAMGYATRIGTRASWINSVLNGSITASAAAVPATGSAVPEPATVTILAGAYGAMLLRRRRNV
jgi:hypothetical protein